jgi:hypothetical protein
VLPAPGREDPVGRATGQDRSRLGVRCRPSLLPVVALPAVRGDVGVDDLLPRLRGVVVEKIECVAAVTEITARWWPAQAVCPACGTWSSRVHGRLCPSAARQPGRRSPSADPPGHAPVPMPEPGPRDGHCRRARGRADRPEPALQRAAGPVTGAGRAGAGRLGWSLAGPALGFAVHRSMLLGPPGSVACPYPVNSPQPAGPPVLRGAAQHAVGPGRRTGRDACSTLGPKALWPRALDATILQEIR